MFIAQIQNFLFSIQSCEGDKLNSYGGNLTLAHSGVGRGQAIKSSTAIMTGNRLTLHYIREQRNNQETKIFLTEKDWVRIDLEGPIPATKEDMIKVLSDIQVMKNKSNCGQNIITKSSFRFSTSEQQQEQT